MTLIMRLYFSALIVTVLEGNGEKDNPFTEVMYVIKDNEIIGRVVSVETGVTWEAKGV